MTLGLSSPVIVAASARPAVTAISADAPVRAAAVLLATCFI
jgi:hypothetical protein